MEQDIKRCLELFDKISFELDSDREKYKIDKFGITTLREIERILRKMYCYSQCFCGKVNYNKENIKLRLENEKLRRKLEEKNYIFFDTFITEKFVNKKEGV